MPSLLSLFGLLAVTPQGTPSSIEGILLQYGIAGVVIIGLVWFVRYQLKRMEDINKEQAEQSKRFEDDNRRLYQIMTDQMIPALTRASIAVTDATNLLTEIQKERQAQRLRDEAREEERKRRADENR